MFDNIGGKIKTLAVVVCVVGMIASLIFAIVLWSMDSYRTPTIALGFGVLIGGCVVSWVGSFFTYGFGQLIEDTAAIREALKPTSKPEIEMRPMMNAPEHEARTKPVLQYAPIVGKKTENLRWTCQKCKCINTSSNDICSCCGSEKERIVSSSWVCKSCGLRNNAGTVCEDCGKSKE